MKFTPMRPMAATLFTHALTHALTRARRGFSALTAGFVIALVFTLGIGLADPAQALPSPPDNTVYGNSGTTLYTINTTTGAATSVGTLAFSTAGIGRDPVTGRVYYAENALPGRVAYFDPTTATNTILPTSLGFTTNRMGFRADGQMFSMNPGTNNIYVVDKTTGNPTIVATVQNVPLNGGGDMAFAPNGDLYIVTSTSLFRLLMNPIAVPPPGGVPSIATTVTSTTPGNTSNITGLLFISNTRLLGTPGGTNAIVDINFTTGGNTNPLGTVVMSDLGGSTKFADLVISVAPSSASFPRTGSASYAVNVVNNGPESASGAFTVSFTLPAGVTLVGAGPFGSGWSCAGSAPTVCTNTTSSLVVGASLPTLSVPVTTAISAGTNSVSTTFTVASTTFEADPTNNVTTTTTSVGAATITKAFLTNPITPGGVSTLVFTLDNPTAAGMTGVSFSDTLPTVPGAMVVATPPNASFSGCGAPTFAPTAGAASLAFSAGSIAAGANCSVRVDVTATISGTYNNTSSGVTTTQTGAAAGAVSNTAPLLVMTPVTITKAFSPSQVIPNGPMTLTLTLTNPAANGANAINGVTFTDTFPTTPGAMTLADTTLSNGCGGTLTDSGGAALAAGSTSLKLVGGTLAGNGASCVITLRTKAPTAGTYNNTTTAVASANAGTGAVSNTASVVVSTVVAPSISKDFSPTPIAVTGTSTLTFTITNPNPTTALTGVAFSDAFPTSPGAMTVAAVPAASTSGCGTPTFAPAANAASIAFSAGTIAGGATCVVKVDVKISAVGAYNNTSTAVTATGPSALTGNTANAVLATLAPPVVAKSFSPNTIGVGAVSTVTIQISNPNGTQVINGVAFTDTLPTAPGAMTVAAVPAPTLSGCGAPTFAPVANATSVAFSGGTLAGGGVCTVSFNVSAPAAGSYTNSTGSVTTTNGGSGSAATAVLTVVATAPPSITKTFVTKPMAANVPATLKFVITNPNTSTTLSGIAFSDTLPTSPGAMVVAPAPTPTTSGCGAPTFAPAAGAASVAFSGASIAAGGTCTVTVQVVAPAAGTYANTTSAITSTTPATSGAAALDNVDLLAAPGLTKTFVTNPVALNVPTTLRFALSNPNATALTSLAFNDVFPTSPGAMVVAAVPNASTSAGCTAPSFAPTAGAASVAFSTGSVAAGATCTVSVDVVVPVAGSYNNTSAAPTSANGGSGSSASASLSGIVLVAPSVSKAFASAGPIAPNTPNQATITLGNSNASAITLASTFTDTLPANVTVASPANSSGSCVGVTATPGASTITLAGGASIPSGGCTIAVNVVASTGGTFTNTIAVGGLATSAGANAAAASASFTVPFAPVAVKSFTPNTVAVGATSVLKITLTNPNAGTAVSGAAFTDTFPAGLVNTAAPAGAISGAGCSGTVTAAANGSSLALATGVIPAGGSCDITVNVTSATAASYLNSSGPISTTNVGTGSASSATLTVAVGAPLTVLKSFTPAAVAPGAPSVLKIRLTNPNGVAVTSTTFNDAYPAGLVNTASPAGAISGAGCSGSVTAAVNGTSLALAGGTIPANASCDVTVNVTSATPGSYLNDSGPVSTGNNGVAAASSATLVVLSPPTVTKSFVPASVAVGSPAVLKITLANPNVGTAISGAAFNDTYPAGLVNTATPLGAIGGSAGCAGTVGAAANGTALTLTGGALPAGGSCDITVNVTSASAGSYINSSGAVTTTNAGNGTASLATLTVAAPLPALAAVKSFAPASIGTNDSSVLTIRLTNPNASAVTGAAFTDAYPGSLVNTGAPAAAISGAGCSGSVTAAAGGASLVLTGANVPANASCDISVNVTSASAASLVNSTGSITAANAATTTATTGTLTVLSHVGVAKSFSPTSIAANTSSVLKITLTNPNATALTGAAFTDAYPAGLVNTATPTGAISGAGCSGSVTAAANGSSLALAAATIPASGSCDITVNVTSAASGSYVNNSGAVSTANAGAGVSSPATLTVTASIVAPSIAKVFSPNPVNINFATTLTITITNPNASLIAALAFNDPYPAGLVNAGTPAVTNTCGGSVTGGAAGGASLGLTGGTLAAGASCTVTVKVSAPSVGAYVNTTSAVTTTNGGTTTTGTTASQTLNVTSPAPPFIAKAFTPATVGVNQTSTLHITITNPNTALALDGVAFSDAYPSGLMNAMVPNVTNSCGGAVTGGGPTGTSIGLTAGSIAAGGSCTITVDVSSAAPGSYANTTGNVTSTTPGVGTGNTASSTLTVAPKPSVAKSFSPAAIAVGGTTTLSLAISNASTSTGLSNLALTDTFPANLVIASPNALANSCGGSVSAAPGSGTLSLSGGSVASAGTCTVSVAVTSSVAGTYNNTSGGAASTESGSAGAASNTATLLVLLKPTIAKSFAPTSIATSGVSTLTLVLTNPNLIALTGAAFTDAFPANLKVAGVPNATNTCTGTFAPASGDVSVSLAGGVIPPSGSCSVKVDVASALAGAYDNTAGGVATNETGAAGAPSNTATLTVTASGVLVSGYVYSDANHNLQRDAGEAGTGLALYAKLVPAATPAGPATQAVAVNASTGLYQLASVSPGEYIIVIDDNATLTDVTPVSPPGWIGTEAAGNVRRNVVVAAIELQNLNFGAFNGNLATGRVFNDNGAGGAVANNGVQEAGEAGIAGVAVKLTDAAGSLVYSATQTDGGGNYLLWIPAAANGASLKVVETNPAGLRSTGASAVAVYDRATDTFTFTYALGSDTANLNFGDVPLNLLAGDGQQGASPGAVVFYAHTFTPGSAGSVSFSATSLAGWAQVLYRDSNCNGLLDAGETVIAGAVAATAGSPICVILKVSVPGGAAFNAQDRATLQADFTYTNASPALMASLTNTDLTTVGTPGTGALTLLKTQDNSTPSPGSTIGYTITYSNTSSGTISAIRINDGTPAFTTFLSASCVLPLPAGVTACAVTSKPALGLTGAIEWTLTGGLLPAASGQVTFAVRVD